MLKFTWDALTKYAKTASNKNHSLKWSKTKSILQSRTRFQRNTTYCWE